MTTGVWERWTTAWEGRLHAQLSGARVSQECGVAVLLGSSFVVVVNFPNSQISSRHILNISIILVFWGKFSKKLASGM